MDLLNMTQAAQFMGVHRQTMENRVKRGTMKPDIRIGHRRFWKRETLIALKEKIESMYTLEDIAEKYKLSWEMAYFYFRIKREVEMTDSLKPGTFLFEREAVEMVAKAEGWIES